MYNVDFIYGNNCYAMYKCISELSNLSEPIKYDEYQELLSSIRFVWLNKLNVTKCVYKTGIY